MIPRLWHSLARTLRRLGACAGALVVLVMLAGILEAHPHGGSVAVSAGAGDALPLTDAAKVGCPHETGHQHADGECCVGPGCVSALVWTASFAEDDIAARADAPCSASGVPDASLEGQFRPPRAFPAA